jgi:hypothetical protein
MSGLIGLAVLGARKNPTPGPRGGARADNGWLWYDAQFSAEIGEIDEGLTRLRTRLELIGDMELVLNNFWRGRNRTLPFSVSNDIEESRRQLLDILKRASWPRSSACRPNAFSRATSTDHPG